MTNSFLTNNLFTLSFTKIQKAALYLQRVNIPGVSLTVSQVGNPFSYIKEPDTKLQFEDLVCYFKLDENFEGYLQAYEWIRSLGFPESFDEYAALKGLNPSDRSNVMTDAILTIGNNSGLSNVEVHFRNIFPYSISDVDFTTTTNETEYNTVVVRFAYDYHNIKKLA